MRRHNHYDHSQAQFPEAGEWLREQRKYWGITRAELAEQAGAAGDSLIEEIEAGRTALPHFMHAGIARTFGINDDALADYCEEWYGREYAKAA